MCYDRQSCHEPLMPLPPSTLFPYTTLFRSRGVGRAADKLARGDVHPSDSRPQITRRAFRLDEDERKAHQRDLGHARRGVRSEEHTSELQSQFHLVCRLLLEKKKECMSSD